MSCHANAGYMLMYYSLYSLALYTVSHVGGPLPNSPPCSPESEDVLILDIQVWGPQLSLTRLPKGRGKHNILLTKKRTSRWKGSIRGTQGDSRTWNRFLSIVFLKSSMYHCLVNCSTVRGRPLCHKHCTEQHSSCIQSFWSNSSKQKYITSCTECIVLSSTSDLV